MPHLHPLDIQGSTTTFLRVQNAPLRHGCTYLYSGYLWRSKMKHRRCIWARLPRIGFFHLCPTFLLAEPCPAVCSVTAAALPDCMCCDCCFLLALLRSSSVCLALATILLLFSVTCCHKLRFLLFQILHHIVAINSACIAVTCSNKWKIISGASSNLFINGSIKDHRSTCCAPHTYCRTSSSFHFCVSWWREVY